jgi:hypothetical protein
MLSPASPLPEVEPAPSNSRQGALLAAITGAGATLRFLYISRKSFWLDEGVSVAIARLDWPNFLRILWRREANMALYYVLLRGWLHLGGSETAVRAPRCFPSPPSRSSSCWENASLVLAPA